MKILFTGASSFTGFWFVKTLAAAGHEVVCPITKAPSDYTQLRGRRIEGLTSVCRFIPQAPFGSDNFLKAIRGNRFDLLCHHGADVTDYKSPDFDVQRALARNTHNLPSVIAALKETGAKGVMLTGTVFEKNEGGGEKSSEAASPYGLSKTLTSEVFQTACADGGVTFGKFVIPNPFGPFEEVRFTAYLMNNWRSDKTCDVKTPDYIRDNIHVDLLASAYADFVSEVNATAAPMVKMSPSGYVESQGEFAQRLAREVRSRTGWTCGLRLGQQTDFSEPFERVNTEPMAVRFPAWSEAKAWDQFVQFYRS